MTSVSFIFLSHPLQLSSIFLTIEYFQIIYLFFNSLTVCLTAPTVVTIRYGTPRFNKIFSSYFLVFGKCGVTLHRLYRGSTLKIKNNRRAHSPEQNKQGAKGLKAFAVCVVTVNDEHTKSRFKRKHRG